MLDPWTFIERFLELTALSQLAYQSARLLLSKKPFGDRSEHV
jgi:hypothetical protein